jgi:hypothetical protein
VIITSVPGHTGSAKLFQNVCWKNRPKLQKIAESAHTGSAKLYPQFLLKKSPQTAKFRRIWSPWFRDTLSQWNWTLNVLLIVLQKNVSTTSALSSYQGWSNN